MKNKFFEEILLHISDEEKSSFRNQIDIFDKIWNIMEEKQLTLGRLKDMTGVDLAELIRLTSFHKYTIEDINQLESIFKVKLMDDIDRLFFEAEPLIRSYREAPPDSILHGTPIGTLTMLELLKEFNNRTPFAIEEIKKWKTANDYYKQIKK